MSDQYPSPHYRAYLLRFWEERREDPRLPGVWRFSLEDPHSGARTGFPNLEALVVFLRQQTSGTDDPP
jgi:hypothetical protein